MFLDTLWLSGTCSMDEGYDGYINIPGKKVWKEEIIFES
jgi:hypothetical protein